MKRLEVESTVAAAGGFCLLMGSAWAFGFGGMLIFLGLAFVVLSASHITVYVTLTAAEREAARFCFPHLSNEDAYSRYAKYLVECDQEGLLINRRVTKTTRIQLFVGGLYKTYITNFDSVSKRLQTMFFAAYERVRSIHFR